MVFLLLTVHLAHSFTPSSFPNCRRSTVKMLLAFVLLVKPIFSTLCFRERNCLLKEAEVLHKARFNHIIQILGICNEPEFFCIVTEYMSNGSLDLLLHEVATWEITVLFICIHHDVGILTPQRPIEEIRTCYYDVNTPQILFLHRFQCSVMVYDVTITKKAKLKLFHNDDILKQAGKLWQSDEAKWHRSKKIKEARDLRCFSS